jgi:aryl-alcohol dehydrogenase-like predicted oxidoreductase
VQPPSHLFRLDIETALLPYTRTEDIGVLAYGTLAHGLLTGTMTEDTRFAADDWRTAGPLFEGEQFRDNLRAVADLQRVARDRGTGVSALAIAGALAQPVVDVAIVGSRRTAHIDDALTALGIELSGDDLAEIDRIMPGAVPVGGPSPDAMP